MADQADKKKDAGAPAPAGGTGQEEKKPGGLLKSTPMLLGVAMVVEAGVLIGGYKILGGGTPQSAHALVTEEEHGGGGHGEAAAPEKGSMVEVSVLDFKTPNKQTGRTFLYDVSVVVVTRAEHKAKVEEVIKARKNYIQDRVRTIIAQSDPEKLGGGPEPGLETLRRQIKYQLDEIVGEGIIDEVLVPRCIPYRADF